MVNFTKHWVLPPGFIIVGYEGSPGPRLAHRYERRGEMSGGVLRIISRRRPVHFSFRSGQRFSGDSTDEREDLLDRSLAGSEKTLPVSFADISTSDRTF